MPRQQTLQAPSTSSCGDAVDVAGSVVTCICHGSGRHQPTTGPLFQWAPSSSPLTDTSAGARAPASSVPAPGVRKDDSRAAGMAGRHVRVNDRSPATPMLGQPTAVNLYMQSPHFLSPIHTSGRVSTPSDHVHDSLDLRGAFNQDTGTPQQASSMITITSLAHVSSTTHSIHVVDGLSTEVAKALGRAPPMKPLRGNKHSQSPPRHVVPSDERPSPSTAATVLESIPDATAPVLSRGHTNPSRVHPPHSPLRTATQLRSFSNGAAARHSPPARAGTTVLPSLQALQQQFQVAMGVAPGASATAPRTLLSSTDMTAEDLRHYASTSSLYSLEQSLTPRAADACMRYMRDKVRQGVPGSHHQPGRSRSRHPRSTQTGAAARLPAVQSLGPAARRSPTRQAEHRLSQSRSLSSLSPNAATTPSSSPVMQYQRSSPHQVAMATRHRRMRSRLQKLAGVRFKDPSCDPNRRAKDAIAKHRHLQSRRQHGRPMAADPTQYRPAPVKVFGVLDEVPTSRSALTPSPTRTLDRRSADASAGFPSHALPGRAVMARPVSRRSPRRPDALSASVTLNESPTLARTLSSAAFDLEADGPGVGNGAGHAHGAAAQHAPPAPGTHGTKEEGQGNGTGGGAGTRVSARERGGGGGGGDATKVVSWFATADTPSTSTSTSTTAPATAGGGSHNLHAPVSISPPPPNPAWPTEHPFGGAAPFHDDDDVPLPRASPTTAVAASPSRTRGTGRGHIAISPPSLPTESNTDAHLSPSLMQVSVKGAPVSMYDAGGRGGIRRDVPAMVVVTHVQARRPAAPSGNGAASPSSPSSSPAANSGSGSGSGRAAPRRTFDFASASSASPPRRRRPKQGNGQAKAQYHHQQQQQQQQQQRARGGSRNRASDRPGFPGEMGPMNAHHAATHALRVAHDQDQPQALPGQGLPAPPTVQTRLAGMDTVPGLPGTEGEAMVKLRRAKLSPTRPETAGSLSGFDAPLSSRSRGLPLMTPTHQ